jgi:hypothetical protein
MDRGRDHVLPEGGAAAITGSGDVLGQSAGGIRVWSAGVPRVVVPGTGAYALNDLATILIGRTSEPVRWDGGVMSFLQLPPHRSTASSRSP